MFSAKKRGFTLIELLTVVAIIALLIGILVPAVQQAMKKARRTAIQAQLYGISQGLEMFKGDFGYYPSSTPQDPNGIDATDATTGHAEGDIQGSHRMAFALLGRDQQGCPARAGIVRGGSTSNLGPDSYAGFYYTADGKFSGTSQGVGSWGTPSQKTARKGPYVDPKGFNVIQDTTVVADPNTSFLPLLADKYEKNAGQEINNDYQNHSLILYYAANERGKVITPTATTDSIYFDVDNKAIAGASTDNWKGGYTGTTFCDFIENTTAKVGTGTRRPYNPEGFLLISKGWDGQYGTDDDVMNWERQ